MTSDDRQPVIIAAKRTAIGKAFGAFGQVEPVDLLIPLIHALISETKLDPLKIDDVILGNAAGGGGNVGHQAGSHGLGGGATGHHGGVSYASKVGGGMD